MNILDVAMGPNDANAATVRDYLKALLSMVWAEEEGFSGKRPFGNSGWQDEVHSALEKVGVIAARPEDWQARRAWRAEADKMIQAAIADM